MSREKTCSCHDRPISDSVRPGVTLDLPEWLRCWCDGHHIVPHDGDEAGAALAIEVSALNVREKTGGPFGALIADADTRRILSVGVNLVVRNRSSILHAETVALLLAQQKLGTDNLGTGGRNVVLYTSSEPCAMCMGAIPWGGVRRVVCGARDEDVRSIGFDEGIKPAAWAEAYRKRGIEVVQDVLREEAVKVLREYAENGGPMYGSGHSL